MSSSAHHYRSWLGLLLLVLSVAAVYAATSQPPLALPTDAVATLEGWADESSCIDCHDEAASFWQTGHARTLSPVATKQSLALLRRLSADELPRRENTSVRISPSGVFAITGDEPNTKQIELDWCFGSGHHACTWTSTMQDSSGATDQLEFRWTWYHGDVIDVTPGQPAEPSEGHFGKLGVLFDGPKTLRCFSCHSSYLPSSDNAIDELHIKPGVTCQRCHGPKANHVASDGEIRNLSWKPKDRLEAVNRCAQCHRRADELTPEEVQPENKAIVRFQPVGLVQSKCFTHSEMTCSTCHDPHLPFEQQDTRGIWQCVQCHSPQHEDHVLCAAQQADDCLECHMPAIKMDAPVFFTDHWIRIREADDLP